MSFHRLTALCLMLVPPLPACGGLLVLDEATLDPDPPCTSWRDCPVGRVCIDERCVVAEPCSPFDPEGLYCPEGRHCVGGVCVNEQQQQTGWCDACAANQGCLDGSCVDITTDNSCAASRPAGVCPDGEVCVVGQCVPIVPDCNCEDPAQACADGACIPIPPDQRCAPTRTDGLCPDAQLCVAGACVPMANSCSPERPQGLCPSGATCVGGYCLPIGDRPCGESALDGFCPAGQVCQAPGQCVPAPCSTDVPYGNCPAGQACVGGDCLPLPCSLSQPAGACPDGTYCSASGACLPEGTCAVNADCPGGNSSCSCEGVCINRDTCLADCDCPEFYLCNLGNATCERDFTCTDDDDCPTAEFCAESDICLIDGSCEVDDDCRSVTRYCSELPDCSTVLSNPNVCQCLNIGQCRTDADCANVDATYRCTSAGNCQPPGYCESNADCPPGHTCDTVTTNSCVKGPDLCTDNAYTTAGCASEQQVCCSTENACCLDEGALCSSEQTCIQVGECLTGDDCLGGAVGGLFTCTDFLCVPVGDCNACDEVTEKCSAVSQSCIPKDRCVGDADCAAGEYCHATFTCVPALNCGTAQSEVATLLKANVMFVLDRSGSMQKCDDSSDSDECCGALGCGAASCYEDSACTGAASLTTRWTYALQAINDVTAAYDTSLRFGLSTYPLQWCGTTGPCQLPCNLCSCDRYFAYTGTNACYPEVPSVELLDSGVVYQTFYDMPGEIDVSLREFGASAIQSFLTATFPGGNTPTGPTLRAIRDNPYGLGGAGFSTDGRENLVILITDGEANRDPGCGTFTAAGEAACLAQPCCTWDTACRDDAACKVNSALGDLQDLSSPIYTHVVGFAFSSINSKLNCHAVYGGRSRCPAERDRCSLFDAGGPAACTAVHCAWSDPACIGDDDYCASFTDDGEAVCNTQAVCVWDAGASSCAGDSTACGQVTSGGEDACLIGACHWDAAGPACRDSCWTHTDSAACTAGLCHWDGASCVQVDETNCAAAAPACYYDATDAAALNAALNEIISRVATCTFRLGTPPPDPDQMYVYLEVLDAAAVPADCSNQLFDFCRLPRDRSKTENWDYDPVNVQVEFYGDACASILASEAQPLILFGCSGPGG